MFSVVVTEGMGVVAESGRREMGDGKQGQGVVYFNMHDLSSAM